MTTYALILSPGGDVRSLPIPDGFVFTALCVGKCVACGGIGAREYPMPASHPKRNPRIPAIGCHDCNATGQAHVWEGSRIAVALEREATRADVERHETVRLFEPAPAQIPGQLTF